ncbi:urate hydroxylase PuuD [Telmatospirillum sp. J64-1]|uniref:urate hydroxylase PuuD n=1 Tax=Telmatospirillum sp. J64-1 TaxID=2502183 RepID=UPI00115D1B46|nr:urate hydroxylase PuuD [Telmatospirillum sp. J64-1]
MDAFLTEWLNLALRWMHIIVGIAWIGSSFYFNWQDSSLRKNDRDPERDRLQGEVWMVHGGGFYHVRKFLVAPARLPDELHWFKWEAYATWATGLLLLILIYYMQASAYLLPADSTLTPFQGVAIGVGAMVLSWLIYDGLCRSPLGKNDGLLAIVVFVLLTLLAYGLSHVFSGRGMYMQMGAVIGTLMAVNVFAVIIPGQKRIVAALEKGETANPADGKRGKQRSLHNNYMTLPVLFTMISNHYPTAFGHEWNWAILAGLALIGAVVRHYFNLRNRGINQPWILPAAGAALVALALVISPPARSPAEAAIEGEDGLPGTSFAIAQAIVEARCNACHSARPTYPDFPSAPNGVAFDTPQQIQAWAAGIQTRSVESDSMPLGNVTGMTQEERVILGRWIAEGAHIPR